MNASPDQESNNAGSEDTIEEDDIEDIVATPASPTRSNSFIHLVKEGMNMDSRSIFNKIDAEYMAPIFGSSTDVSIV